MPAISGFATSQTACVHVLLIIYKDLNEIKFVIVFQWELIFLDSAFSDNWLKEM